MSSEIEKLLNHPFFQEMKEYVGREDIFQVLGKERWETSYSKMIAWILSSERNKESGLKATTLFVDLIPNFTLPSEIKKVTTLCEKDHLDLKLDIELIKGDVKQVIIENKINADTSNNQLKRYYDKYKGKNTYFVVLAPNPDGLTEQHSGYTKITYQEFLNKVLVPVRDNNPFSFINQFIHAMEVTKPDTPPIAITDKLDQDIKSFLQNEEDLIINVLNMMRLNLVKEYVEKKELLKKEFFECIEKDGKTLRRGLYLRFRDDRSVLGPFKKINSQMLHQIGKKFLLFYNIKTIKEFVGSKLAIANAKSDNSLLFQIVGGANTSYHKDAILIEEEGFKEISGQITTYSQIRTPEQELGAMQAIKKLGFDFFEIK
ncbi:MAG: PD-(D/E)XK nuclease family protein [Bacteroidales bacterium]|nr:PD-(D/E)XK nuclease family protein [Bacteroidales bacterium]